MGFCSYPRTTPYVMIPYFAHKVNEIVAPIVSSIVGKSDFASLEECRDNESLLERRTGGGRSLNRDPNYGVGVRRKRGTICDLPHIRV